jgi:hypothetical protein
MLLNRAERSRRLLQIPKVPGLRRRESAGFFFAGLEQAKRAAAALREAYAKSGFFRHPANIHLHFPPPTHSKTHYSLRILTRQNPVHRLAIKQAYREQNFYARTAFPRFDP